MSYIISKVTQQVHQIFIRYSHIISAVNAHLQTVILQLVFERWCKECKWYQSAFMTFSQNQLIAMATSLDISENEVQIYHLHPKSGVQAQAHDLGYAGSETKTSYTRQSICCVIERSLVDLYWLATGQSLFWQARSSKRSSEAGIHKM